MEINKNSRNPKSTFFIIGLGMVACGLTGALLYRIPRNGIKQISIMRQIVARPEFYVGGFQKKMCPAEAVRILNIEGNLTRANIRKAYKNIMLINHPDRGGSPYLAAKINEAKELLGRRLHNR